MVVLSAAVCTKSGRALLSRQYVEMSRLRVEGLLNAFPKLVASETSGGSSQKQHTFVETDNVRYVYLPLDAALYLLLVTNKGSNIVEDLDTLRLLSRVIPEQLGLGVAMTEANVNAKAFELLFAFDEVLASGGYREEVTLHQVRVNLEMESHEEKLAEMIKAGKMAEAKENSKRKAQELRAKAVAEEKSARAGGGSGAPRYGGFGGQEDAGSRGGSGGGYGGGSGGGGGGSSGRGGRGGEEEEDRFPSASASSAGAASTAAAAKKAGAGGGGGGGAGGMKLGSKKAGGLSGMSSGAAAGVMAEEGMSGFEDLMGSGGGGGGGGGGSGGGGATSAVAAAKAAAEAAVAEQAGVAIEERLSVRLTYDDGMVFLAGMEVKGSMTLSVHDEGAARLKVVTQRDSSEDKAWSYQNHPNVNKPLFVSEGVVALKAADRAFPVVATGGSVGVLRWRYTNKDDDVAQLPLSLTCLPEAAANGTVNVILEYTLQREAMSLAGVTVTVPLGGDVVPTVKSCDGSWKHNTREHCILWRIDSVTADNAGGMLEFSIKSRNPKCIFPVSVAFTSSDTLCPIEVASVIPSDAAVGDKALRFSATKSLTVDEYVIECA